MTRRLFYAIFLTIIAIVASLNMLFSQQFPPLFYNLVGEKNTTTIVTFLRTIRGEAFFPQQLDYFKSLYGPSIETAVYQDTADSLSYMQNLEKFLNQHPQSHDVLVKLALFYEKRGDKEKAQTYYNRAKKLDPWLDIASLETTATY